MFTSMLNRHTRDAIPSVSVFVILSTSSEMPSSNGAGDSRLLLENHKKSEG